MKQDTARLSRACWTDISAKKMYSVRQIFKRSAVIEREGPGRYFSPEPYRVFLDGEFLFETDRNVITVDGLEPDRAYELSFEPGNEKIGFTTRHESFLLEVSAFGAVGDGVHDDTAALQAAIMACPEEGTVHISKGTYITGPLFLKSNMSFWVDEGATILGFADRSRYPVLPGIIRNLYDNDIEYNIASWEGNPLDSFASLITVLNAEGVDIFGRGTIDGNAAAGDWWQDVRTKRTAWRPKLLSIINSKDIRLCGLHFRNSPCWALHPYYSDRLGFFDLDIENPADSPNTDGFDPESCRDVLLLGTRISVGDDCIAIKSGKLYMAKYHHKETENITVRNCLLESGHGSVTVGSEVAGGVKNVHVSKCIFRGTDRGVRIKTRRGRGERSVLVGLLFEDITMDGVHMPVTMNMFYFCDPDGHSSYVQDQSPAPVDFRTPKIGGIELRNADCSGVDASLVCAYGLPEAPIGRISLKDIRAEYLPEEKRTPQCPIMMDGFPKLSGRSLVLKNVKELDIENVSIKGSADTAPDLTAVDKISTTGLEYN